MIAGILMDTPRVSEYLDSVADGFHKNPGEIIASIGGVAALIFVLLFLAFWWRRKEEQKRLAKAESTFSVMSDRLNLTFSEIELLKRLLTFGPGGKYGLPALVKSQQQFNIAAKRALKRGSVGESEIAALRFRLGHITSNTRGILNSTAALKPGTAVELIIRDKVREYGSVVEVTSGKFTVKTMSDSPVSGIVELRFARPTGIYSCSQRVVRYYKGIAEFRHTERLKRIQKRRSLRNKVVMLALIVSNENTFQGELIDLSEGGARIKCSGTEFRKDQSIEITLFENSSDPVAVPARVVRVDHETNTIGAEFQFMNDKVRERIINNVFH
jgi:hypothetical protein